MSNESAPGIQLASKQADPGCSVGKPGSRCVMSVPNGARQLVRDRQIVKGLVFLRLRFLATLIAVLSLAPGAFIAVPAYADPAEADGGLQAGQPAVIVGTEGRGLRVRGGPGMGHGVVTTLAEGGKVQVIAGPVNDGDEDWYQISYGPAKTGWGIGRYMTASTGAAVQTMSTPEGNRTFLAKVTAYADGVGGVPLGAKTYSGTRTRWGVVAVDPKTIPIGSTLTIEGYEGTVFLAEDIGGGIKGEAIDIWLPDQKEARTYGTQYRRVTVTREGPAKP